MLRAEAVAGKIRKSLWLHEQWRAAGQSTALANSAADMGTNGPRPCCPRSCRVCAFADHDIRHGCPPPAPRPIRQAHDARPIGRDHLHAAPNDATPSFRQKENCRTRQAEDSDNQDTSASHSPRRIRSVLQYWSDCDPLRTKIWCAHSRDRICPWHGDLGRLRHGLGISQIRVRRSMPSRNNRGSPTIRIIMAAMRIFRRGQRRTGQIAHR